MTPAAFPQSNRTLTAPNGMNDCGSLPVYSDGQHCVSRWRPSLRERLALLFGRDVWLWVRSGRTQPPVALGVVDPWANEERAQ